MKDSSDPVLAVFRETGAYLRGHFRLTSGLHSSEYLQCALVLQYPNHAESFGRMLAGELGWLMPLDFNAPETRAAGQSAIGEVDAR